MRRMSDFRCHVVLCSAALILAQTLPGQTPAAGPAALFTDYDVVDLSVLVSENLPGHWGANPPMQRWAYNWFVPLKNPYGVVQVQSEGPYYAQRYVIDEHTGTQTDFPAHFVP